MIYAQDEILDVDHAIVPFVLMQAKRLDEPARQVIKARFGLGERQTTLQELAYRLDVSVEAVRFIEAEALRTVWDEALKAHDEARTWRPA